MKKSLLVLVCLAFLWGDACAETIIISNKSGPPDTLSPSTVKEIILGKFKIWGTGERVKFATMMKSALHEEFLRQFTRQTPSEYKKHWKKILFTGKGIPPKSFKSEAEVIEYVATTEGAIGYVSSVPENDNVKVITVSDE